MIKYNKILMMLVTVIGISFFSISIYARGNKLNTAEIMGVFPDNSHYMDLEIRASGITSMGKGEYKIGLLVVNNADIRADLGLSKAILTVADEYGDEYKLKILDTDKQVVIKDRGERFVYITCQLDDNTQRVIPRGYRVSIPYQYKKSRRDRLEVSAPFPEIQVSTGVGSGAAKESNSIVIKNISLDKIVIESIELNSSCLGLVGNTSNIDLYIQGSHEISFKVRTDAPKDADGQCLEQIMVRYKLARTGETKTAIIPITVQENTFLEEHKTAIMVTVAVVAVIIVSVAAYYYFSNGHQAAVGGVGGFPPGDDGGGFGGGDDGDGWLPAQVVHPPYTRVDVIPENVRAAIKLVIDSLGKYHLNGKYASKEQVLEKANGIAAFIRL